MGPRVKTMGRVAKSQAEARLVGSDSVSAEAAWPVVLAWRPRSVFSAETLVLAKFEGPQDRKCAGKRRSDFICLAQGPH